MADGGILWQLAAQAGQNVGNAPDAYIQGLDWRKKQDIENNRKSILQQLSANPSGEIDAKAGLGQFLKAGDLAGATQFATAAKSLQPETTDELKEYKFDMAQRRASGQPALNFGQWKTGLKLAGATRVNNTINTGDNQYEKEMAVLDAKDYAEKNKLGLNATNKMNTLSVMEGLTKDPNFFSGWSAPTALKAKQALISLGVSDPKIASATEAFDALSKKMVLDLTGGSLGTGFSNADRDFVIGQVASLQNSPEGITKLIEIQRKLAQREQQVSQRARDYAKNNKGRYRTGGFTDEMQQYSEQNPLFQQTAPQAPAAPQANPRAKMPSVGEVRSGYRFRGGNPADRNSWEAVQ